MVARLWPVIRREYLVRVRSRAFLIATVLGPVMMSMLMIVPTVVSSRTGQPLRLAVVDASGKLAGSVEAALTRQKMNGEPRFLVQPRPEGPPEAQERQSRQAILEGRLDGYLKIPGDALETANAEYYGRTVSNLVDLRLLDHAVDETLVALRLAVAGLDPAKVQDLTRHLDLKTIRVSRGGDREDRGASTLLSIILMMMLYTSTIMWGQAVLTSVIEEKTNRVVEVVVSSIPPLKLLAGKLLGVGAVGLTQFLIWSLSLVLLSPAGGGLASSLGAGSLPEVTPLIVVAFVLYFLLGYLLYASLFAAVGASVNSTQEAQSLVFPIFMPLVVAVMFFPMVLQAPDSTASMLLSLVPFFTPLLMFLRITVLTPPPGQIALSFVLTPLAIAGVLFVAARIYRVGILMYGKRPALREILRWVRHRN
jgi:ABC-2 type transport system permease protein